MPASPKKKHSSSQADAVVTAVLALAKETFTNMANASPDVHAASKEFAEQIRFMLSYVTLYHAGLLCFERFAADLTAAEAFDDALLAAFQKKTGDRGYVQFVGFSIAEALKKRDVLFAVEMCKVYTETVAGRLETELKTILA